MTHPSTPLSENFKLEEFLHSNKVEDNVRLKQEQENPPAEIVENLQYLVNAALQPIRTGIGFPLKISSGYRCRSVNELVGGSRTSQHCLGEAADCQLLPKYFKGSQAEILKQEIKTQVQELTGSQIKDDVSENFFLFAYICLHLEKLDIDQVIHEYGDDFGRPAWIHVAASKRQDKREILCIGDYTNREYLRPSLEEALSYGT